MVMRRNVIMAMKPDVKREKTIFDVYVNLDRVSYAEAVKQLENVRDKVLATKLSRTEQLSLRRMVARLIVDAAVTQPDCSIEKVRTFFEQARQLGFDNYFADICLTTSYATSCYLHRERDEARMLVQELRKRVSAMEDLPRKAKLLRIEEIDEWLIAHP
jgi:hypothetical protein